MILKKLHVFALFVASSSFVLIVLMTVAAHAQISEYQFKSLTVDHGLSQNSVYAILQDRRGFMWFGTKDGLNRYDGYNFVIYKHDPNDSTSLADNSINVLYEDKAGRMWIATGTALQLYDPLKEHFRRIPLFASPSNEQTPVSILAIAEDDAGKLWLGTLSSGLIQLLVPNDESQAGHISITYFRHDPKNPRSLYRNHVPTVYLDSRGTLWVGTDGRLQSLNPLSPESGFDNHPFVAGRNLRDPNVLCVYEDSQGNLWLGTTAGLGKYNRETTRTTLYPWRGKEFITQDKGVRTICEDEHGMLWLGTFGRLVYFDTQAERYRRMPKHIEETNDLFRTGTVRIVRDRSGALWFGSNGYGVFRHDAILNRFQSYTNATGAIFGWQGHSVRSIYEDAEHRLWIGSYGGLYVANPSRTSFDRIEELSPVRSIMQDSNGRLWFAAEGLIRYDPRSKQFKRYLYDPADPTSISSHAVSAVFREKSGQLWIVAQGVLSKLDETTDRFTHYPLANQTEFAYNDPVPIGVYQDRVGRFWLATDKGLFVFDTRTTTFTHYISIPGDPNCLSSTSTRCVTPDPLEPDRILWIGTAGGGLNRLDLETEQFTAFTEADGLPNNVVYAALGDTTGNLWLSTNRGIARFNPRLKTFQTYLSQDGLQSNEYNSGAYHHSKRGEMFFGGINGFDVFNPYAVSANSFVPDVVITEFRLFNKPVTLHDTRIRLEKPISEASSITLSYGQNVFSLLFASLDYTAPNKNLYQYMLEGFEEEFSPPTTNRTATYTNLDPGTYTFRVRGSNSDGVWNETGASLAITVLPPFWMTWWFRSLLVLLFLSVGPFVYYRRVTSLKRERTRQQEFSRMLIDSQEGERKRIAAELHDSLGQNLLVMKNRAVLGLQKTKLPKVVRDDLKEISNTASATLKEVREISHNLRPYELDRFGLTEAIRSVVEKVQASSTVAFTIDIDDFDVTFDKESEINVYRAVQECLNNIIKHAEASRALVRVKMNNNHLQIAVQDNGKGFQRVVSSRHGNKASGLGLTSLEERARILNGSLTITSAPGSGTTISMTIPLERTSDGA